MSGSDRVDPVQSVARIGGVTAELSVAGHDVVDGVTCSFS
jgi:hypothetical protein